MGYLDLHSWYVRRHPLSDLSLQYVAVIVRLAGTKDLE